ncbi:MAG TPA: M3 family metallopeptidase [Allosphingosinicella sp.]|jgi:thimet oligopeptidase
MHAFRTAAVAALLTGVAAPALAAPQPASDAIVGPILANPKSPAEVGSMCDKRIAGIRQLQAKLEQMPLSTPAPTLLAAYDDLYNLTQTAASTEPGLIKDTHPDADIRKAAEDCLQRTSEVQTVVMMSRPIYERLLAVEKQGPPPELRYMVTRQVDNYRRAGVAKDEATRKRIADLQKQITETALEFDRNINEGLITLTATPAELEGLPADYLAAHPAGADGKVTFTTAYPDMIPVLRYAKSEPLRKRALIAFLSRAYPKNDAVFRRLAALRTEYAKLLGYPSFAHYDLANRMARSPDEARAFIDDIASAARPMGERDAARMLARLKKDDPAVRELGAWSSSYASRLIRTEEYQVDPQVVRQYFAFDKVKGGIFTLTQDLFGVEIRPWQTDVWSPEVEAYELVEQGKVIGRFYLDLHPREKKYSHAAMFPIRMGIKDRSLPVAALICNFPTGLMEHGDVVTFLHEFGHLLHWMFSGQVAYAAQNFGEIENDVIEAPSQLLEEWVWDYDTLNRFATNEKGEPIPADLVAKMNAGRRFGEAFGALGQLGYSAVSLDYYSGDLGTKDLTEAYQASYGRYALAHDPAGAHPQASFGHLSGYGAAYYTYSWSKALASDLLSPFRAADLRDPATARRYRELILAPGGSQSMNVLAKSFLGRDWSADAYRKELERGSR